MGICTDGGTEALLVDCPMIDSQTVEILAGKLRAAQAGEFSSDAVANASASLHPDALSVLGTIHVLNNGLEESVKRLDEWKGRLEQHVRALTAFVGDRKHWDKFRVACCQNKDE